LTEYLIALGVILGVNLLPAFGPPTWSVLVFFQLNFDLAPAILVPAGAVAAASGRFALASGARRMRGRFSPERLASLDAAEASLTASRSRTLAGLGLFALSPVPSAQLFIAAGLLRVPLVPLTAAFFAGRLVSYSIYVGAASVASESLGAIVGDSLTSPLGIGLQVAMLGALVMLVRIDWRRVLGSAQGANHVDRQPSKASSNPVPVPSRNPGRLRTMAALRARSLHSRFD
jgi:membrane protein YqaA with SNARE-associated domain